MKLKIAGLWLWKVSIRYDGPVGAFGKTPRHSLSLWITTRNKSIEAALKKARGFLKRSAETYPKAAITKIKEHGYLDA